MKRLTKRLAVLWVLAIVLAPWAQAQTPGTCLTGTATVDLDINNVRARLFNNGGLFWKGAGNVYNVPKVLPGKPITPNALFASGIWFGGQVDGEERLVAADYSAWELWPGPLDENGELPGDGNCSKYDEIFLVSREDVQNYEASGSATPNLQNWPVGLGAPTFNDLNGNDEFDEDEGETEVIATSLDQKIDLAAGQRPNFLGDQMAYWVMNDVGGVHASTGTEPMGMEVQVTAFAFNLGGALGNTTFYKYKLVYKGDQPLTNAYFGIWSDPDLGDATDDWVGSDTTLGLGFVYNSDNNDASSDGYGIAPPALGYDFFQGPLVDAPGETWTDPDSTVHVGKTRLPMTVFLYYNNDSNPNGNPRSNTSDWYNYLQGIWQDGKPMVDCGDGYDPTGLACADEASPTKFMWPGDPVTGQGWSEPNFDRNGTPNPASDRRFLMSTGPFVIEPGDVQEIVYGIVWAKGDDNMDSVLRMKQDDAVAQSAYDSGFQIPPPPAAPRVNVTELDNRVILSWSYLPQDNNYLEQYEQFNPFSFSNGGDRTLNFEGYRIYQYTTEEFDPETAQLIATYDVNNGVTRVIETDASGLTTILVDATDSGIQNSIEITGLTNYTQYYFGVEAYAYNGNTDILRIHPSPVRRVVAMPAPTEPLSGGAVVNDTYNETIAGEQTATSTGGGIVTANVVDPLAVTGDEYRVDFYEFVPDGEDHGFVTYDIVNTTTGEKVLDGRAYAEATGEPVPQKTGVLVAEGLQFNVTGPPAAPLDIDGDESWAFVEIAGPGGVNACGTVFGCAAVGGDWIYGSYNSAPAGSPNRYIGYHIGAGTEESIGAFSPNDYEIRFTADGGYGYYGLSSANVVKTPFELWDIGPTGAGSNGVPATNDPSDDVQMIPLLFSDGASDCFFGYQPDVDDPFGVGFFGTQRIYGYYAVGDDYAAYENTVAPLVAAAPNGCVAGDTDNWPFDAFVDYDRGRPIQRFVFFGPNTEGVTAPAEGTVVRFLTTKPNAIGDSFVLNSADFAPEFGVDSVATANLDDIGIVPNPYKGASAYEVSNLQDIARFVNLPERATIRIFTLSGTLVRTLEKSGPSRSLDWDLQTEDALPIASGMYLIHVEVPGVGEKVIKFGVIKKRIQLDLL